MTDLIQKYTYRTEWSEEDGAVLARCLELPWLTAHGKTPEKAILQMKLAVLDALDLLAEEGESPPEPLGTQRYSGRLLWRMGPSLHREVTLAAAQESMSINQYLNKTIAAQLRNAYQAAFDRPGRTSADELAKVRQPRRTPRRRVS